MRAVKLLIQFPASAVTDQGSADLVTLQDVPTVNRSRTDFCPHVAQVSWDPAENMGNHDEGRPTNSKLLFTHDAQMKMGESLQ